MSHPWPHGGAASIWREHVTDGVPASGAHKPRKSEIRAFLAYMQAIEDGRLPENTRTIEVNSYVAVETPLVKRTLASAIAAANALAAPADPLDYMRSVIYGRGAVKGGVTLPGFCVLSGHSDGEFFVLPPDNDSLPHISPGGEQTFLNNIRLEGSGREDVPIVFNNNHSFFHMNKVRGLSRLVGGIFGQGQGRQPFYRVTGSSWTTQIFYDVLVDRDGSAGYAWDFDNTANRVRLADIQMFHNFTDNLWGRLATSGTGRFRNVADVWINSSELRTEVATPDDVLISLENTIGPHIGVAVVINAGSGYTSAPTLTVSGGGGTGCVLQAVVAGGQIIEVNVVNPGTGYVTQPTVTITGGGGTGGVVFAYPGLTTAHFAGCHTFGGKVRVGDGCRAWDTNGNSIEFDVKGRGEVLRHHKGNIVTMPSAERWSFVTPRPTEPMLADRTTIGEPLFLRPIRATGAGPNLDLALEDTPAAPWVLIARIENCQPYEDDFYRVGVALQNPTTGALRFVGLQSGNAVALQAFSNRTTFTANMGGVAPRLYRSNEFEVRLFMDAAGTLFVDYSYAGRLQGNIVSEAGLAGFTRVGLATCNENTAGPGVPPSLKIIDWNLQRVI